MSCDASGRLDTKIIFIIFFKKEVWCDASGQLATKRKNKENNFELLFIIFLSLLKTILIFISI